jgi:hypothetical protein
MHLRIQCRRSRVMAPVKPMGVGDPNESTARGVTGFHQEYNQEKPTAADLNPDAVTEASVLPKPAAKAPAVAKAPRTAKRTKK